MKQQTTIAMQELVTALKERAVEVVEANEAHALDLATAADVLEKILSIEGFKFESKITNKPLVDIEPAFKNHPFIEALISGKQVPTDIETKNLSKLKKYMFIRILKETNGILTYVKIKDSNGTPLHHKIEFNKGDGKVEYETDKVYLVFQDSFTKKRDSDGTWHFGKEFTAAKAMTLANRLGQLFARAKDTGVGY